MNPLTILLATRRLTQLVVEDEITRPVRERIGAWGDAHPQNSIQDRLSYLVGCSACSSIWAAGLVLLATRWTATRWVVRVLAASGSALALQAVVERVER